MSDAVLERIIGVCEKALAAAELDFERADRLSQAIRDEAFAARVQLDGALLEREASISNRATRERQAAAGVLQLLRSHLDKTSERNSI